MKIELDTAKPDELRKLKREVEVVLATIEAALHAIGNNGAADSPGQLPLIAAVQTPQPPHPNLALETLEPIPDFFNRLPNQFSMRDALNLAPAENISLIKMRRTVLRLVGRGLTQVRRARGPNPAIYRKA